MEVRVRERLIGALVLVAIVVLLVPAILKGRDRPPPAPGDQPTRSVEVRLADDDPPEPEEVLVPETVATGTPTPPPVVEKRISEAPIERAIARSAAVQRDERPAVAAPVARPDTGSSAWAVQLGAFATRDKAEKLVAELRARGYAAFLLEYRSSGRVLHRVRVGPEHDRARAAAIAARLRKDGFEPVVARHP